MSLLYMPFEEFPAGISKSSYEYLGGLAAYGDTFPTILRAATKGLAAKLFLHERLHHIDPRG